MASSFWLGARQGLGHVAVALRAITPSTFETSAMLATMSAVVSFAFGPFVPFDLERRQALLGCAHMRGDDGNGIVEFDDLKHVLDGQCLAVVSRS